MARRAKRHSNKRDRQLLAKEQTEYGYSVLENNKMLPYVIPIGSVVWTQWGPRKVIKHLTLNINKKQDTPPGV
jgi:hypothetical protein